MAQRNVRDYSLDHEVTREEMRALHTVYPNLIDKNGRFIFCSIAKGVTREDHEYALKQERTAREDSALKLAAAQFARSVIDSLTPDQRIQAAAPPSFRRRHAKAFDYRCPQINPSRHTWAMEWDGVGNFYAQAAQFGHSLAAASDIRQEISFALLLGDQPLTLWDCINDRDRRPQDSNLIVGAMLREFWKAHDDALKHAERITLIRNHTLQWIPGKPALCAEVFGRLTDTKVGNNSRSAKAALKAIDKVAGAFRKEMT